MATKLGKLLLKLSSTVDTQILSVGELILYLQRHKEPYRILYVERDKRFILAPAYNIMHDTLINYYNLSEIGNRITKDDTQSLLFTPKQENLPIGGDGNDTVYIFKNFGSLYTKNGMDLPQVLLKSLVEFYDEPTINFV